MKHIKNIPWRGILSVIGLLIGNLLVFLTIWLANKYDHVSLDQFIYQMKSPATGANRSLLNSAWIRVGLFGIILTAIEIILYLAMSGSFKKIFKDSVCYLKFCSNKFCCYITHRALPIAMSMLLFGLCFFAISLDVVNYVDTITTDSDLIERHYVNPYSVNLNFPEKKRNLIYIFLESMEVTFSDTEASGAIKANYIVELTRLAENNINFSHDSDVGGALSYTGTTWTAAAMVTQTSGVIVQVPLTAETYGGENEYMPGVISIGEVLEKEGYNQTLLVGSDAAFAGRDSYFSEHGNYNIVDTKSLKADGRLPENYDEWWGYEDEKLFQFAKDEITKLSESGKPFNFTMLTCDTHFPNGYQCRLCRQNYDAKYPNVLRCSARQVEAFIQWIQAQDFYENTTIVLCGDHLTMDPNFLKDANEKYVRTIYNCFINSPIEPINEKNRQFGTFDMFPTTLAAMGVEIEGNRLGLGTNLFSDKETLTEHYSFTILNDELQKNSNFYNETFLHMEPKQEDE